MEEIINSMINKYILYLKREYNYNDKKIELIKYSLESLFLSITKFIPLLLLTFYLKMTITFLLIVIFTKPLRYTSFGYHARNSIECFILSIILFIIIPLFYMKTSVLIDFKYFIIVSALFNHLLFSPSDTYKRVLKNKKKRLIRKIFTLLITSIYFLLTLIVDNYFKKIILISIIISILLTNPLIYILTNQPYQNYLNRKEEL